MGRLSALGVPRSGVLAALIVAAAVAAPAPRTAATSAGAIAGVVSTKEPARKPIRVTIDPGVCGASLPDDAIAVDDAGHLANVIVMVPGVKVQAPAETLVSNDTCRFVPRVMMLKPGGTLRMTSKDPMLHTVHAAGADTRALFNISLPVPGINLSRTIDRPGIVTLSCSTHTWMRAYVYVGDDLAATSAADGRFRLDGVPAGTHELRIWHETLKTSAPVNVTVKDGETTTIAVTMVR